MNARSLLAVLVSVMACGSPVAAGQTSTSTNDNNNGASANALPLGDGHVSTAPRVGYVFSCQTTFGGGGATGSAPWITGTTWDPTGKPAVNGNVMWANAQISFVLQGTQRVVRANNLPTHATGIFPIQATDPAYQYDKNPNSIREQNVLLSLPATPAAAATPSCVGMGMIGVAVSGAAIYNALDAAGRDAAAHEVQDHCSGHPQAAGQYHYHSLSACLSDPAGAHSPLIGYALDGYGIYGQYGEGGRKLTNADLDVCHGHEHAVQWDGASVVMYHYHATAEYPYTLGCYHGTPR
jgi:hypothetical protein